MELWTAFVIGFFGSLHCAGMCGPIALALPSAAGRSKIVHLTGRLLYNFGRIVSYVILGAIFGLLGQAISLAGLQQGLSIFLGILIILAVLLPSRFSSRLIPTHFYNGIFAKIRGFFQSLFQTHSYESLLTIGFLNGFLPCGFVYLGLAGAISTGSILEGMGYMALFGLGTVPIMLGISLVGNFVQLSFRRALLKFMPVATIVLAVLFILRGMSLGIPYISPKMDGSGQMKMEQKADCCGEKQMK